MSNSDQKETLQNLIQEYTLRLRKLDKIEEEYRILKSVFLQSQQIQSQIEIDKSVFNTMTDGRIMIEHELKYGLANRLIDEMFKHNLVEITSQEKTMSNTITYKAKIEIIPTDLYGFQMHISNEDINYKY